MVAAIGVVGFFTMKSTGGTEVPPPVKPPKKDPVVKADPAPVKDPVPKAADPAEILAQAKAKIAEEDLGAATDLLKPLEASNPEAKTLLNKLQQELSFAAAMMEAETALGEGKIAEAQASLKKAAGTEMQKKRLAGIQAQVTEKAAAKLPTANPVPEKDPNAVAVAPQPTPAEKAVAKYEQALEAIKAAKASGQKDEWKKPLALLDQCIGLDPKNFDCHKKRGVTLGKLERPDEAVKAYERFLATAPPSHEDRSTVQQLVTTYKNGGTK